VSRFLFRATRSARAPKEVAGAQALGGVLVVDRYNAYNQSPCQLQYGYAHLLRDVEDLAKEFPGEVEVTAFSSSLVPLLAEAMSRPMPPNPRLPCSSTPIERRPAPLPCQCAQPQARLPD